MKSRDEHVVIDRTLTCSKKSQTYLSSSSSLDVAPKTAFRTQLAGSLAEEDMTADQLEIKKIVAKWKEVKFMSREDAEANLDEEWLAAYNRFYEDYHKDMELMKETATAMYKQVMPEKVIKKTKGQRKRDAYAKKQAYAEAVAAQTP